MAQGFYIDEGGLKTVIKRLVALKQDMRGVLAAEIANTSQIIERKAVQRVPKDTGGAGLAGSIKARQDTALQWEVVANAFYAPYIEFGTGKRAQIPPGLEAYAAQFKGKRAGSGNFKQLVRRIYEWMKRNGIKAKDVQQTAIKSGKNKGKLRVRKVDQTADDLALAYTIARSIVTRGIAPRPFLFPAYNEEKEKLKRRLLAELKKALKKK
jgi:HK97 gp10 family phage protein